MRHSSNQSHFSNVPQAHTPRAKFKRNSNLHTTLDAGYLVPIFLEEVLPADTHIVNENLFGRLATPLKPIMDNMYLDTFYFFVPCRLLMDNFQKLMGEQENPNDSTDFLIPTVEYTNASNQTLIDYFGLPTLVTQPLEVNALPFRLYNLCWNEWFRDENLQDRVPFTKDDGPDDIADYTLLKRGKRHDYFTSCLPFPQKGPSVPLPLGTTAPVYGNHSFNFSGGTVFPHVFNSYNTGTGNQELSNNYNGTLYTNGTGSAAYINKPSGAVLANGGPMNVASKEALAAQNKQPLIYADLTTATAATINELREAFQIQGLFERDARAGTRYTEILRGHFGVISPDSRLQRPEYLGGSSTRIGISPVANTTGTESAAQGDLTGVGTVSSTGRGFTYSATEHGYIIGLASIRADLNYQQGLNKLWKRQTRFDFYWPALAHLGEQAVLNSEIMAQGTAADDNVFGYQERWAEYRYKPNQITGKFRSNDPQSLDSWHLAQDFETLPALNSDFIQENPPIDRVIAVPTEPHMILDCYFNQDSIRAMPLYSIPALIDKF